MPVATVGRQSGGSIGVIARSAHSTHRPSHRALLYRAVALWGGDSGVETIVEQRATRFPQFPTILVYITYLIRSYSAGDPTALENRLLQRTEGGRRSQPPPSLSQGHADY